MKRKHLMVAFILVAGTYACNKAVIDTTTDIFFGFQKPQNFPKPAYDFTTNNITKDGFGLGRKLFYDPILSADNTISCGSCHIQSSAFTQHGHPSVSHGIHDRLGNRNSQPIMNLAWNNSFLWDGGVFNLDLQPIIPITSFNEMNDSVANVLQKLRSNTVYKGMFKKAYGTEEINSVRFLKALSQFMLMCVSNNAKYDSVKRGQSTFSVVENEGYILFKQKCNSCHQEPLFTDNSFRNNGLPPSLVNDMGRYNITQTDADKYKFKVPSLRNLTYSSPYMHDGRFFTLDAVLDHYSANMQISSTLDPFFINGNTIGIVLQTTEKEKIKAFLQTLNDKYFVTNKLLAEQ